MRVMFVHCAYAHIPPIKLCSLVLKCCFDVCVVLPMSLSRLQQLQHSCERRRKGWAVHPEIPGLTLQFNFLRRAGAKASFLEQWEHGIDLGASEFRRQHFSNHPPI